MPALSSLEGPAGLAPGLSSLQWAAQVPGTYKSRILSSEFLSGALFGAGFYCHHSTWLIN